MMSHRSKETELRGSELEEYECRKYKELKEGILNVKVSNSAYRCPFCPGMQKQDYLYNELLRHAYDIGTSGRSDGRERARHLALEKYVRRHLAEKDQSEPAMRPECSRTHDHQKDELFVYPWMGIIANIKTQRGEDGRFVGESGTKLRDEFRSRGFNPQKVHPLWNRRGHSGFAVVEFNKDWDGFGNAIMFEKSFVVDHHGKEDFKAAKNLGDKLYGWIARDDDYNFKSLIGDYLRRNGDLKTVSEKEAEDERTKSKLLTNLTQTLESQKISLREMADKYVETRRTLEMVMQQMDEINKSRNEEMAKMQQRTHDHFQEIYLQHEQISIQLEAKRKQLEEREKQLQHREAKNETERKKLHYEKKMNENATWEQKKADENIWRLAEEHKKEKEELHRKMIELQKRLDVKQALELEIEQKRGSLQVIKHMEEEGIEVKKKMDEIQEEIKEKEERMDGLETLNQALIVNEWNTNNELHEARKELINSLKVRNTGAPVGVRIMGELDNEPFLAAIKAKFRGKDAEVKAMEVCSKWEEYLGDSNWHPFKVIEDEEGNCKGVIKAEDEKLKNLKNDYGEEVYNAVVRALTERNEYNASGGYTVLELWNFRENSKATLKEGVSHLLKQWKVNRWKSHVY